MSEQIKIQEIIEENRRDELTEQEKAFTAQYLSQELSGLTGGTQLIVNPMRALGAKDSGHDVFFIQTGKDNQVQRGPTFACKRFRQIDSAEKELNSLDLAKNRGFVTIEPAGEGIFSISNIGHFLVTKHMSRLNTMNYLGWRNFYVGDEKYSSNAAEPLQRIGRFAAQLHSAGVTHGDLQVKNIGQNSRGDFVLFDLENAIFWDEEQLDDDLNFLGNAAEDIGMIIKSLIKRGFLWSSTEKVFTEEVQTQLLDPYFETITIANPDIIEYIAPMFDIAHLRSNLHSDFASRIGLPS